MIQCWMKRASWTAIWEHVRLDAQNECGGLLLGSWSFSEDGLVEARVRDIYRIKRSGASATFEFSADDQLDAYGVALSNKLEIVGTYHSHAQYDAFFSSVDEELLMSRPGHEFMLVVSPRTQKAALLYKDDKYVLHKGLESKQHFHIDAEESPLPPGKQDRKPIQLPEKHLQVFPLSLCRLRYEWEPFEGTYIYELLCRAADSGEWDKKLPVYHHHHPGKAGVQLNNLIRTQEYECKVEARNADGVIIAVYPVKRVKTALLPSLVSDTRASLLALLLFVVAVGALFFVSSQGDGKKTGAESEKSEEKQQTTKDLKSGQSATGKAQGKNEGSE